MKLTVSGKENQMREDEECWLLGKYRSLLATLTANAARGCDDTIIIVFKETIAITLAIVLHTVCWWFGDGDEGTMVDVDDDRRW